MAYNKTKKKGNPVHTVNNGYSEDYVARAMKIQIIICHYW